MKYPSVIPSQDIAVIERKVTAEQKVELSRLLTSYHKSLVMKFLSEHAHGDVKTRINLPLLFGFSDVQVSQVVDNCSKLFTIYDIYRFIEIWHSKHARMVHNFIKSILSESFDEEADNDMDDEVSCGNSKWNSIIQDDDFLDFLCQNFELEQLSSPSCEGSSISSERSHIAGNDIPNAVLELLENVSYND